ncbi:MAG: 2-oxoacid:ferredoxin oxidoreductase subunit gamma [Desulfobacteraceae bacterium]|nr:MAG: 2-oxoacid:ferredoxin oxidoreductase subunit gamma [Desulfobacteraceae bacterium]
MEHKIIFAGFGGQGVISMGTLMAYSAMAENKNVTFYPAYGIAMRGGTANCSVIISDEPVASPVIACPNVLVVMNEPSLDLFTAKLQEGGALLANSSLIRKKAERKDIRSYYIPVNDIAEELGNGKMANMAMTGALLKIMNTVSLETVFQTMKKTFSPKLLKAVDINREAMQKGFDAVQP